MLTIKHLDHIVLTVADLTKTTAFYVDVLGMKALSFSTPDGIVRHGLGFGDQKINLHLAGQEFLPKATHPTPGSADMCFLCEGPLAAWFAHFEQRGIAIEDGPIRRTGATGPILSVYLRDPDGNLIEISQPLTTPQ